MDVSLICRIIDSQGLSIAKLSRLTKLSPSNLNNKLVGIRDFKAADLIKIKKALGLSNDTMALIIFGPEKGTKFASKLPCGEEKNYFRHNSLNWEDWLIQIETKELVQIVNKKSGEQKVIAK